MLAIITIPISLASATKASKACPLCSWGSPHLHVQTYVHMMLQPCIYLCMVNLCYMCTSMGQCLLTSMLYSDFQSRSPYCSAGNGLFFVCGCVLLWVLHVILLYVAVKVRLTGGEPTTRGDFAQIMQDGVGGIDCRVWWSLLGLLFSGSSRELATWRPLLATLLVEVEVARKVSLFVRTEAAACRISVN